MKECGLFLLPSGFLWVPPTSWLQPEASFPGRLRAQPQPAAGESSPVVGLSLYAVSSEPGSSKTSGKEAKEWRAWVL